MDDIIIVSIKRGVEVYLSEKVKLVAIKDSKNEEGDLVSSVTLRYNDNVVDFEWYPVDLSELVPEELVDDILGEYLTDAYSVYFGDSSEPTDLECVRLLVKLLNGDGYVKAVTQKKELFMSGLRNDNLAEYEKVNRATANW